MRLVPFTDEDINNLLALLNRVQLQGSEAEAVVRLKQILAMALTVVENGAK